MSTIVLFFSDLCDLVGIDESVIDFVDLRLLGGITVSTGIFEIFMVAIFLYGSMRRSSGSFHFQCSDTSTVVVRIVRLSLLP